MDRRREIGRMLNRVALLLLLLIGAAALLLWRGAADPLPTGPPDLAVTPAAAGVPVGEVIMGRLPLPGAGVLEATGRWVTPAVDGGYGLRLLGSRGELAVVVERGGDVGIWRRTGDGPQVERASAPWPHARPAPEANRLTVVDQEDGTVAVWVNRELLWQGAGVGAWREAALWSRGWSEGGKLAETELRWYDVP